MDAKYDVSTWQELLGQLIKNSQEKQRLAREANVKPITLKRWVTGESQPRGENMRRLARALPSDVSTLFLSLIEADFPSFVREDLENGRITPEIPAGLYAQAMQTYAKTPPALARDALYKLIFEHALEHFDPDKTGISLALVCCVPPLPGQKVRSLRQVRGMGTPPWARDLQRKTMFLGSESVVGDAVIHYHTALVNSRDATSFTSANWTDFEQSALAAPILRQARVAGALLASSARPYSFTPAHEKLLELYAHLIVLMLDPSEFYEPSEIMLGVMPTFAVQEPYFANFEQRVTRKFAEAAANESEMNIQLAHQLVWQDIAEELLQASSKY